MNIKNLLFLLILFSSTISFARNLTVFEKKGKYGLRDNASGKVVTKAKYDTIYRFIDGYARVQKKGKFGLLKEDGKEYLGCRYRYISPKVVYYNQGKDYFWVSWDGKSFYRKSDVGYYTTPWYSIIQGPDKVWYGKTSQGKWMRNVATDRPSPAQFKDDRPRFVRLPNKYKLFDDDIYSPDSKVVASAVLKVDTLTLDGTLYIHATCAEENKSLLIDASSGIIWKKKSEGLDGYYIPSAANKHSLLGVNGHKVYTLSAFVGERQPIYSEKDSEFGLYRLRTDNQILMPFKFTGLSVDKNAGKYQEENLWKITLECRQGLMEYDLEEFVKALSINHDTFVIEVKTPTDRSLFGRTGKELVRNNFEGLRTKNGLLRVTVDGKEQWMNMSGPMDLDKYDSFYQTFKGNLTSQDVIVVKNNKVGLYVEGKGEVVPPLYDGLWRQWGHIHVNLNGLKGLYTDNGRKVFDPKYSSVSVDFPNTSNPFYFVRTPSGSGMILGSKGEVIVPPGHIDNVNFLTGEEGKWCPVYKNGKLGIVNLKAGKLVIPCLYHDQIFWGSGDWPNERIGIYRTTSQGEVVEIWTIGGKKITSKVFPSSALYRMKHFLEDNLHTRLRVEY